MRVIVIDYDAGNLRSVETALRYLDADFAVTAHPDEAARGDALIIPGVGDAKAAMERLDASGLSDAIREVYRSGNPIMGICLGSQIVLDASAERDARCLSLIPGRAEAFGTDMGLKVPHMGWNTIDHRGSSPLLAEVPEGASVYFVHSYYPSPASADDVLTTTAYGITFASSIAHENIVAFQFHPEKSGRHGLKILSNFLKL